MGAVPYFVTPLHPSVSDHPYTLVPAQVVALLLAAGADCLQKNDLGHTPLDLARRGSTAQEWMSRLAAATTPGQRQRVLADIAGVVGTTSTRQRSDTAAPPAE
jgi:hypothetical protein